MLQYWLRVLVVWKSLCLSEIFYLRNILRSRILGLKMTASWLALQHLMKGLVTRKYQRLMKAPAGKKMLRLKPLCLKFLDSKFLGLMKTVSW